MGLVFLTGDLTQRHGYVADPGGLKVEVLATDLNPVEHQFVPQAVVAYDTAPELRLLPPNGVMKQSPS